MHGGYEVRASRRVARLRDAGELAEQWAGQLGQPVEVRRPWWRCWPGSPVVGRIGGDR